MIFQRLLQTLHLRKKKRSVMAVILKPNIVDPMLIQFILVMNQSANLLKKLKGSLLQKIAVSMVPLFLLGNVTASGTHKHRPIKYPIQLVVTGCAEVKVLLVVMWSQRVNKLPDVSMFSVVSINPKSPVSDINLLLDHPVGHTALSQLHQHVPVRLKVGAVHAPLGLVRPMVNNLALVSLGYQGGVTDGTPAIELVGVVVIPNSFACVVENHVMAIIESNKL